MYIYIYIYIYIHNWELALCLALIVQRTHNIGSVVPVSVEKS